MFYDDSWVGTEPCGVDFPRFGFDGIIKCVFSGFEVRLCASVPTAIHELRLHPYLFPTGVNGEPSFLEGGDPVSEARDYWMHVRRAMLRQKIDRIGLGGYLHLVSGKPDFVEYIAQVAGEFRAIRTMHEGGAPAVLPIRVAVLHSWGALRPWTLCGHFHEAMENDLIHVNESLSGLPLDVQFIDFEDVKAGALRRFDAVINAGAAGTAWSGGDAWRDERVVEAATQFVREGGLWLGIGEPGAVDGKDSCFQMAHVLGVDAWRTAQLGEGQPVVTLASPPAGLLPLGCDLKQGAQATTIAENTQVWVRQADNVLLSCHAFGKGRGIYLSAFEYTRENSRLLLNLILYGCNLPLIHEGITDNPHVDCACYPGGRVALVNASSISQTARLAYRGRTYQFDMAPYEGKYLTLQD